MEWKRENGTLLPEEKEGRRYGDPIFAWRNGAWGMRFICGAVLSAAASDQRIRSGDPKTARKTGKRGLASAFPLRVQEKAVKLRNNLCKKQEFFLRFLLLFPTRYGIMLQNNGLI